MMSLNKISLPAVVKNQFLYKLRAYTGVFTSLVILQILAILFSLGANGGGIGGSGGAEIQYSYYSIQSVITFTFIWGFIHSIIMTTKTDWENAFSFIGNRLSNDLSNAIFLFFASVIGGLATVLTAFTVRVIVYYFIAGETLIAKNFILTGEEIFSGTVTIIFHLLLFCAMGYLLGTITRLHRLMPVLLPVSIIGIIIALVQVNSNLLLHFIVFYFEETNPWIFIIKIVISVLFLFGASILISSRTEVRK